MKRHPSETLDEVAERLVSIRSALNPIKHKFVWDELTLLAADIRRLHTAISNSNGNEDGNDN